MKRIAVTFLVVLIVLLSLTSCDSFVEGVTEGYGEIGYDESDKKTTNAMTSATNNYQSQPQVSKIAGQYYMYIPEGGIENLRQDGDLRELSQDDFNRYVELLKSCYIQINGDKTVTLHTMGLSDIARSVGDDMDYSDIVALYGGFANMFKLIDVSGTYAFNSSVLSITFSGDSLNSYLAMLGMDVESGQTQTLTFHVDDDFTTLTENYSGVGGQFKKKN